MSQDLIKQLESEHQEIYDELAAFLDEISAHKKEIHEDQLTISIKRLLDYVQGLLETHFRVEERNLFPEMIKQGASTDLINRLLDDHKEIEQKYQALDDAISERDSIENWQTEILFPAYNLLGCINHHAAREDRELF